MPDQDGWLRVTTDGHHALTAITAAGDAIAARADAIAAPQLADTGHHPALTAIRTAGFTNQHDYEHHLTLQHAAAAGRAAYHRPRAADPTIPAQDRDDALTATHAATREADTLALYAAQHAAGRGPWHDTQAAIRATAYRDTLAALRPLGPPGAAQAIPSTHPTSDPDAVRRLNQAASYLPTDWLADDSTRPLLIQSATDTARYVPDGATVHLATPATRTRVVALPAAAPPPAGATASRSAWGRTDPWGETYVTNTNDAAAAADPTLQPVNVYTLIEHTTRTHEATADQLLVDDHDDSRLGPGAASALHGYGHRLQLHVRPRISDLAAAYVASRTTNAQGRDPLTAHAAPAAETPPTTRAELAARADSEWVRAGTFATPQAGREHIDPGNSEHFATSLEALCAGRYGGLVGAGPYTPDLGSRSFTLGLLATL